MTYNCRICLKSLEPWPMGEKNGYEFFACRACGSVATDPFPTQAALDKFFGDIQPEATHGPDPDRAIETMKKRLMNVTRDFIGRRFLDVCCRQGYAVKAAKTLGMDAKGIDAHDFLTTFAKATYGADLFQHTTAQAFAETGQLAEVIFSVEGFCEQPDVESYTAALAKILAPGGKLYIEEPNGNSTQLPKKFTNWAFADPPLNFNYISYTGMKLLLARHGLKVERKFFTWSPFMRMVVSK